MRRLDRSVPDGHDHAAALSCGNLCTNTLAARKSRGIVHAVSRDQRAAAGTGALVDPRRNGMISASACFGDSGGPVMRGSELVGIITRAAHPAQPIACGHLTRWAPVVVTGAAPVVAAGQ